MAVYLNPRNLRIVGMTNHTHNKYKTVMEMMLRRHVPGYEGCYLIDSADVIGVRETRRFEANYQLNGRNISGTHKAHSSYRVMPIVMNMGHAMGIVAAMCVAQNKKPLELDIHEVQDELRRTNVEP